MNVEKVDLRRFRQEPTIKADEVLKRRRHFVALGFSDPWIDIVSQRRPTLWAPEVIDKYLKGLSDRGFNNPNKMIESSPAILGYALKNIDRRLKLYGRLIRKYSLPFQQLN